MLSNHLVRSKDHVQQIYNQNLCAVADVDSATEDPSSERTDGQTHPGMAAGTGQWPRLCPTFFLQQLSRHRWHKITKDWKRCIVGYALAITELQRAERLVSLSDSRVDLIKELRNPGHTNWDPVERPESLLLEVESGFLIRDVQEKIARQMRDATENATMQLTIGEGKSSVIVPVVAAALADGSR